MKERPILFSDPMVRAILSGQKMQTRRVINPPFAPLNCVYKMLGNGSHLGCFSDDEKMNFAAVPPTAKSKDNRIRCPFGQAGDSLWVREAHYLPPSGAVIYRSNWQEDAKARGLDNIPDKVDWKWIPSIFMFKQYSRINLQITNIRVERLQDISEDDAFSEGVEYFKSGDQYEGDLIHYFKDYLCKGIEADDDGEKIIYNNTFSDDPISSFRSLWDSINGKKYPWHSNPWVWVVEFERLDSTK